MQAIVVIDVQNDFCEGGSLAVGGGTDVAAAISRWLSPGGGAGADHVVATRDRHIDPGAHFSDQPDFVDTWPPHCVVGTTGPDFHPALVTDRFEAVFDKGEYSAAYSGFEGSAAGVGLADWLRDHGVDAVELVGIAADHCVRATALDAVREGFATAVRLDLTAGVARATTERALRQLADAGVRLTGEPVLRD